MRGADIPVALDAPLDDLQAAGLPQPFLVSGGLGAFAASDRAGVDPVGKAACHGPVKVSPQR
jgi:hypothetical protein